MEINRAEQIFYANPIRGDEFQFDTLESRHIAKVLRKKTGDLLYLTDGQGFFYQAEIIRADKNKVIVKILEKIKEPEPKKKLHLFIAPLKSTNRMEWALEKSTELGVWEITPVITKHTERKKLNYERLDKIIIAAVKQSKRAYKPVLHRAINLEDFIQSKENAFVALCQANKSSNHIFQSLEKARILIGPEGGFSLEEIRLLEKASVSAVRLGSYRLRSETAAIAATCLFHQIK